MLHTEDISNLVDLLCKLKINIEQYLLCMMIKDRRFNEAYRYVHEIGVFKMEDLLDLEEKGYIYNFQNGKPDFQYCMITDKFLEVVYNNNIESPGEELWDIYPNFIRVDNKKLIAKNTNKDKFCMDYSRKYGMYVEVHKKIMEITQWGKEKGLIQCGIQKYLETEQWNALISEKKQENNKPKNALPSQREF